MGERPEQEPLRRLRDGRLSGEGWAVPGCRRRGIGGDSYHSVHLGSRSEWCSTAANLRDLQVRHLNWAPSGTGFRSWFENDAIKQLAG